MEDDRGLAALAAPRYEYRYAGPVGIDDGETVMVRELLPVDSLRRSDSLQGRHDGGFSLSQGLSQSQSLSLSQTNIPDVQLDGKLHLSQPEWGT